MNQLGTALERIAALSSMVHTEQEAVLIARQALTRIHEPEVT